jgi:hypothetical protein
VAAATLLAAAVGWSLTGSHVSARDPTPDERGRVEAALRSLGYTRWDDIDLEGDRWEVDDARGADGKEYDLKLDRETLRVISREEEDDD